jgi:hypothetical protein
MCCSKYHPDGGDIPVTVVRNWPVLYEIRNLLGVLLRLNRGQAKFLISSGEGPTSTTAADQWVITVIEFET